MPDNLKPDIAGAEKASVRVPFVRVGTGPTEPPLEQPRSYLSGNSQNLGGTAAVSIQVDEGRIPSEAPELPETPAPVALEGALKLSSDLSEEDRSRVAELKARDREVRAHESAHAATGQGYAGSPQFDFIRGPDGVQYAVGGHVSIDTQAVADNPEATIEKMQIVRAAALAPARPSGQDRAVASKAEAAIRQAEGDLRARQRDEAEAALEGEVGPGKTAVRTAPGGASDAPEAQPQGILPPVVAQIENTDTASLPRSLTGGVNLIA